MDKVLGTSLGKNSELVFDLEGRLVHMTKKEYEKLQGQSPVS